MPENQNLNNEQQETTSSGNKIYILSRNNYDNWQGSYGSNIFFVRENSADQDKMVSVYVGESKQSNIVVTDESDIWDRTTNDYTIPEKYQVSDKLFLIKRTLATGTEQETSDNTIYGIVTWNGERFIDCGIPNNVIVLTNIEEGISDLGQWLSQNITGIKDFIYIVPNYHSIYYYDGANGYISIISVDSFVTVEMLNEVASRIPVADELTVLSTVSNNQTVFSAVGGNLSGKTLAIPVPDVSPTEYMLTGAEQGAHIFNDYDYTEIPLHGSTFKAFNNTVAGQKSNAFGTSNIIYREATFCNAFGTENSIGNTTQGSTRIYSSAAIGENNTVRCSNSTAIGYSNKLNLTANYSISVGGYSKNNADVSNTILTPRSVVIGNGNTLSAIQDSENNFIFGKSNSIGNSQSGNTTDTYIFGWDNHAGSTYGLGFSGKCMLIGNGLTIDNTSGEIIIGKYNFNGDRTSGYPSGLPVGDFRISDGTDATHRHDALSISNSTIYINTTRSVHNTGEIVSGSGAKLSMVTSGQNSAQFSLPTNNCITYVSDINSSITITTGTTGTLANKFYFYPTTGTSGTGIQLDSVTDYSCLLVVPKISLFNSASNILTNFTANDASKIYLLNPDIDISSYTTLHVLLFYDLTNLCAIVSGYQEVTNP